MTIVHYDTPGEKNGGTGNPSEPWKIHLFLGGLFWGELYLGGLFLGELFLGELFLGGLFLGETGTRKRLQAFLL